MTHNPPHRERGVNLGASSVSTAHLNWVRSLLHKPLQRSADNAVAPAPALGFAASVREWSSDLMLRFVVHEASQPMTALVGSTDLLRRRLDRLDNLPPEVLEDVARLRAAAQHVKALLSNTRDRLGPADGPRRRFSLSAHLRDLLAVASSEFSSRGIQLVFRPPCGDDCIEANPTVVAQILWNLLRNALEANASAGVNALVQVHVEADAQSVSMTVSDTGDGIPPAVVARIGQQQPVVHGQNMGLGLGVCHQFALQQGGNLQVVAVAGLSVNAVRARFPKAE